MRNEAKHRQLLQARYNQSRGTSLKDSTQTKLRSDSANVTRPLGHFAIQVQTEMGVEKICVDTSEQEVSYSASF